MIREILEGTQINEGKQYYWLKKSDIGRIKDGLEGMVKAYEQGGADSGELYNDIGLVLYDMINYIKDGAGDDDEIRRFSDALKDIEKSFLI